MSDRQHSICFSGHRLHKATELSELSAIQTRLAHVIREYVQEGFYTFYVGMADGFDMMAAEEVVKVKGINENRGAPHPPVRRMESTSIVSYDNLQIVRCKFFSHYKIVVFNRRKLYFFL